MPAHTVVRHRLTAPDAGDPETPLDTRWSAGHGRVPSWVRQTQIVLYSAARRARDAARWPLDAVRRRWRLAFGGTDGATSAALAAALVKPPARLPDSERRSRRLGLAAGLLRCAPGLGGRRLELHAEMGPVSHQPLRHSEQRTGLRAQRPAAVRSAIQVTVT
eukprot:TRINITY_DN32800_c0_g1_i1.p3 TRINITY_DN32800_c0_g1~~TRINITY_DN32800_c0_g1_i1.p3  ORF type:complete len:162 (+),score=25.34 TRINITY_DN32800_c0_g1_i1:72-557(+)